MRRGSVGAAVGFAMTMALGVMGDDVRGAPTSPTGTGSSPIAVDPPKKKDYTHTEFLLLIDDSGSMDHAHKEKRGSGGTDPDRLAILAANVFVELLAPDDRVAVVGMNAMSSIPAEADKDLSVKRSDLDKSRTDFDKKLQTIGEYNGAQTPCQTALARSQGMLKAWHGERPGARLVMMFLTDGKCEGNAGKAEDPIPATAWRTQLGEWATPDALHVYVVEFAGNAITPGLVEYADGNATFKIGKGEERLRDLVDTFAKVLTRAQGYSPIPLDKKKEYTFARADRVRVLAVEKGSAPIDIRIVPAETSEKIEVKAGISKISQYEKSIFTYRVDTVEHDKVQGKFSVKAAASHTILIPEYKNLKALLHIADHVCPKDERVLLDVNEDVVSGDTHESEVCLQAFLSSDKGRLAAGADDLIFEANVWKTAVGTSEWSLYASMDAKLNGAAAKFEAKEPVDLHAEFNISGATLKTDRKTLRYTPLDWKTSWVGVNAPTLARSVAAGSTDKTSFVVRVDGNFANMDVRFTPPPSDSCVQYQVVGATDNVLKTGQGQEKTLQVTISPHCRDAGIRKGKLMIAAVAALPDQPKGPGNTLPPQELEFELDVKITPWHLYWGPWILKGAAGLFALVTLLCILRGFRAPVRTPGNALRGKRLYYSTDFTDVAKPLEHFDDIDATHGAKPLRKLLEGQGGWYRNASVNHDRLKPLARALGIELTAESQVWLVAEPQSKFVVRVVDESRMQVDAWKDWSKENWNGPTATLRTVGFPCRLYAGLFGRWTVRKHISLGKTWLAISRSEDVPPELVIKLDDEAKSAV